MVDYNVMGQLRLLYLLASLDPVVGYSVLADYIIQQSIGYLVGRGVSAGAVSLGSRLIAPVKDVFLVNDYVFQSRSVDEFTGRVGGVTYDTLSAAAVFLGTDQLLQDKIPGAQGILLGGYVTDKITKYNETLMIQAAAGEIIRKRIATLSVFEKFLQASTCYMNQSFSGISILHFLSFQANIAIAGIGLSLKILVAPFLWRRRRRIKKIRAANAIRRVFNEEVIDVDFLVL